jgi:hypothetical protein
MLENTTDPKKTQNWQVEVKKSKTQGETGNPLPGERLESLPQWSRQFCFTENPRHDREVTEQKFNLNSLDYNSSCARQKRKKYGYRPYLRLDGQPQVLDSDVGRCVPAPPKPAAFSSLCTCNTKFLSTHELFLKHQLMLEDKQPR